MIHIKSQTKVLAGLRGYASTLQRASRANYKDVEDWRQYCETTGYTPGSTQQLVFFQRLQAHNSAIARRYLFRVLALQAMDVS